MENFIRLVGLGGVLGLAVELPVVAMRTYRATCRHESGLRLDNYRWLLFLGASFGFLVTLGLSCFGPGLFGRLLLLQLLRLGCLGLRQLGELVGTVLVCLDYVGPLFAVSRKWLGRRFEIVRALRIVEGEHQIGDQSA